MTAESHFRCNLATQKRFRSMGKLGQELVTMPGVELTGPCDAGQAGGALRETTQSRSQDPTVQPQR